MLPSCDLYLAICFLSRVDFKDYNAMDYKVAHKDFKLYMNVPERAETYRVAQKAFEKCQDLYASKSVRANDISKAGDLLIGGKNIFEECMRVQEACKRAEKSCKVYKKAQKYEPFKKKAQRRHALYKRLQELEPYRNTQEFQAYKDTLGKDKLREEACIELVKAKKSHKSSLRRTKRHKEGSRCSIL